MEHHAPSPAASEADHRAALEARAPAVAASSTERRRCWSDDEHGGWATLFQGVAESLAQARDEHRAAREATDRLSHRYQGLVAQEDRTNYIHLRDAVIAAGVSSPPVAGMHWRGRLSEVSGWSFGHLRPEPPAAPGPSDA